jgi:NADH-quinone oxidoreductase subunit H
MIMMTFLMQTLFQTLVLVVSLLISVAFVTLLERKILAVIQRRQGPNVIGPFGVLQPLSDGLKLLIKEPILPNNADKLLFALAPVISFLISLLGWGVIPFSSYIVFSNINLGLLYILSVSSLGVYGIIISGWASNSKYAFLGALRSSAQIISYELAISFSILNVAVLSGSLNISDIVFAQRHIWYVAPLLPAFIIFFIAGLAETNRHPFDLPEAEAELVSGYNVEYSGMTFALFSLAEYSNILMMSTLISILFFGGWQPLIEIPFIPNAAWLIFKILIFVVLFIYIRAILPRYRYDQLMIIGWKKLIPLSLGYLLFTILIVYSFNMSIIK